MRALLALAALLLAGCADAPAPAGGDERVDAGDDVEDPGPATGSVLVVVVTPAIEPIQGAQVMVQGLRQTTAADGSARFDGIAVGQWPVEADAPGRRAALAVADVRADQVARVEVKLLAGEGGAGRGGNQSYQETYRLDGFFDCSATYLIITGDCMTVVDFALANATGACAPVCPGDFTNEEYVLAFPLDAGWRSLVAQMHWEAGSTAGKKMTFAVEPAEAPADGHAAKYAKAEGGSPLIVQIENGVPHESATVSADGEQPDMPQGAGGEVLRTRSFVQGEFHRPGGTGFLGVGLALQQQFEVIVTVFYGEPAPAGYTAS